MRTQRKRGREAPEDGDVQRVRRDLEDHIASLYELSAQEKVLVADTLRYTIKPFLQRNAGHSMFERSTSEQLRDYAVRLCHQISGILEGAGMQLDATIMVGSELGLHACRFSWRQGHDGTQVSERNAESVGDVLAQISIDLRTTVADRLYVQQDLRVYDDQAFWIIKPSQARLWSEVAALNDADAVLREHMDRPAHG